MSNEKTVLPLPVIITLYRNSLYRNFESAIGSHLTASTPETVPILGNNSKKVLLIVRFETEPFIPERHLGFIARMLSACNMNIGDVAIVNDKTGDLTLDLLYKELRPLHTIIFGIDPRELNISIDLPLFTITTFKGCQVFHTPSLDALNQDSPDATANKKKLWACLKLMFSV